MLQKLVIQIPCYNEAGQIQECLRALPKSVPGFSSVETLVIDDGSTDATASLAREAGATHLLQINHHVGLARAFCQGMEYAFLTLGADVLVNYDADQEHLASDISALVAPICAGQADYTLGQRPIMSVAHFSWLKKCLQRMGSAFVSLICRIHIPDATTGFRAMNRETGIRLSVWTRYSYTLETLVQAVEAGLRVQSVPIHVQAGLPRRPSRLVTNSLQYCWDSFKSLVMTVVRYRPFATFLALSIISFVLAGILGIRFLIFAAHGGSGRVQSLVICAILTVSGLSFFLASILGEATSMNRLLIEQLRYEQRRRALDESP